MGYSFQGLDTVRRRSSTKTGPSSATKYMRVFRQRCNLALSEAKHTMFFKRRKRQHEMVDDETIAPRILRGGDEHDYEKENSPEKKKKHKRSSSLLGSTSATNSLWSPIFQKKRPRMFGLCSSSITDVVVVEDTFATWRDYSCVGVLGRGSFGVVSLAQCERRRDLALKSIALETLSTRRKVEHALEERATLEVLRGHCNVIELVGAWRTEGALHLLMPCCVGGELFQHLQRKRRFQVHEARFIAAELSAALLHTHAHFIIFRDLKPENVLFDAHGHVVLADFGLAKRVMEPMTPWDLHCGGASNLCGTPEYMAPEVLNKQGTYGAAVDWWSLGIVIAELATGLPPWYTTDRPTLFDRIRYAPLELGHTLPPGTPTAEALELAAFVASCLRRRVPERISDATVRSARFFAPLDFATLSTTEPPFNPMYLDGRLMSNDEAITRHFSNHLVRSAVKVRLQDVEPPPPPPPPSPGSSRQQPPAPQRIVYERELFCENDTFTGWSFISPKAEES